MALHIPPPPPLSSPVRPADIAPGYILRGPDRVAFRWVLGMPCPAADDAATIFKTPAEALRLARKHRLRGVTTERNFKQRTSNL